jgi:hypothetical protein
VLRHKLTEYRLFGALRDRAMGLFCTPSRIYLSSKYQLWQLDNVLAAGPLHKNDDRLYIPRLAHRVNSCFGPHL